MKIKPFAGGRLADALTHEGFHVRVRDVEGEPRTYIVLRSTRGADVLATFTSNGFETRTITFGNANPRLTLTASRFGRVDDGGALPVDLPRTAIDASDVEGSIGRRLLKQFVGILLLLGLSYLWVTVTGCDVPKGW